MAELFPLGIIRLDSRGLCLYVNTRWSLLTGMTSADASGDGWQQSVAPADRERVVRTFCEVRTAAGEFADEFRLRTPDGRGRPVSCRVLPLRATGGEVTGCLATITDLTERHHTEDALRDLARELRDRIKELKCLIEIAHIVEASGESLPDIMQRTADLLASSWGSPDVTYARIEFDGKVYQTANYRQTPWRQLSDLTVDGRSLGVMEVGYLERMPERHDGPFLVEEQGILDAVAERLSRTVERLKTQQMLREREQELRERLTRLARINVMGEMAASIAHEVNQPLAAIGAYAQGCRRILETNGSRDGTLVDAVNRITLEAMRAGGIVHRLDHLARKHRDRRERCDVNELVRDVYSLASVDARLHDVRLVFEPAAT
ncbi:MAG: PAS domain S-box protein, partial [Polyangiales bacterium]